VKAQNMSGTKKNTQPIKMYGPQGQSKL
jgi:hypothetical protein